VRSDETGNGLGEPVPNHEAAAEGTTAGSTLRVIDGCGLRDTFARSHTWGLTEAEVDDLRPYLIGWRGFQFIGVDLCKLRKVSARSRGAGLGFHQCRLRIEIIAARNTGVQAA
jgi:hypothetical protein